MIRGVRHLDTEIENIENITREATSAITRFPSSLDLRLFMSVHSTFVTQAMKSIGGQARGEANFY